MLIYDRKGNSIDVYTMNPKVEELKRYRKNVMRRQKAEDMFYRLKTNCPNTLIKFNTSEDVDIKFLDYDNDTVIETGYWSRLCPMGDVGPYDKEIQQKIIENARFLGGNRQKTGIFKVWQGKHDSNMQPTVLETATLPLSYSPKS